jgi:hypothetical protein
VVLEAAIQEALAVVHLQQAQRFQTVSGSHVVFICSRAACAIAGCAAGQMFAVASTVASKTIGRCNMHR